MPTRTQKRRRFHVRFEEAEEGGYIVSVPEMPGCVTQAETFEEGLMMIKDALEGLLEVAVRFDDPFPDQLAGVSDELARPARRVSGRLEGGRKTTRAKAG